MSAQECSDPVCSACGAKGYPAEPSCGAECPGKLVHPSVDTIRVDKRCIWRDLGTEVQFVVRHAPDCKCEPYRAPRSVVLKLG